MAQDTRALIYEPRPAFLPFHNRSKRWTCMVCHRRAGKTVSTVNDLIIGVLECRLPRPQFAYVAPFRDQAKRVAWAYLKYYSEPFWASKPNESELTVHLFGERKISLFGADNPDALRGIYLDGAALDEFGDFKPSVWGNVIRPALSDRRGWAVFGGTPKGRNEFWEVRELARKNPDEWQLLELRASESGLIRPDELDTLRRQLSPEQYAQEYECDFAAAILGAFYGKEINIAEREGRIANVEVDTHLPVHTAWDIGYRDDTAIWWYQVVRGEIHILDFHASSGQNIEFYIALINGKCHNYGTHWLPHDAKAKTLASGGKSIIEQLAVGLGMKHLAIVPNLEIQDGIQAARIALARTWFDSGVEEGIECLRQYQREWDEDKKCFREKPRHDWTSHAADAFRMMAVAWRQEAIESAPEDKPIRGITVGNVHKITLNEAWAETAQRVERY